MYSMVNMLRIPNVHTRRRAVFTQMLYNLMSMEIGAETQEKKKAKYINNQFPGPFSISRESNNWRMNIL